MWLDNSNTFIRSLSQVTPSGSSGLDHTFPVQGAWIILRRGTRSHMLQLSIPHATVKTHQSQINKYFKTEKRKEIATLFSKVVVPLKKKNKRCVSQISLLWLPLTPSFNSPLYSVVFAFKPGPLSYGHRCSRLIPSQL